MRDFIGTFLYRPLQNNNVSEELEPQWVIFYISISNLSYSVSQIQFRDSFDSN